MMLMNGAATAATEELDRDLAPTRDGQGSATVFEVAPEGRSWLIKHNRGVLGRVADKAEAVQIASGLAAWCQSQGRLVSFQAE